MNAKSEAQRHGAPQDHPMFRKETVLGKPPDLPPHIAETVQAIALLHDEHHRRSTWAERIADEATAYVGRPRFLLGLITLSAVWVGSNLLLPFAGITPPDHPPFAWMGLLFSMLALLIAILILTSQRRADRFANLREQMTLEATLLTEQKTRKIIELIEELRRDSPEVVDRIDSEAEQMATKADPHAVLGIIEEATQERAVAPTAPEG
jgi:uncharacterized membrane protein